LHQHNLSKDKVSSNHVKAQGKTIFLDLALSFYDNICYLTNKLFLETVSLKLSKHGHKSLVIKQKFCQMNV